MAKRDIVAVCMESPVYFTMPLRERLELVNRQSSRSNPRNALLAWVKTGFIDQLPQIAVQKSR
jgi:hypothetical protein